jgi:hypothetical protein
MERLPPEQKVGGSNPLGRTTPFLTFQSLTGCSRKSDIRKNERGAAHEYYSSWARKPAHENTIRAHGVSKAGVQNGNPCVPPEPVPEPEPLPDPVPEPVAARALRAPAAVVRPIRLPERKGTPGGISPDTWDDLRNRYATSGKGLNDTDWAKAAQEAVTLGLSESDLTERVIPRLEAELPEWAERDIGMIPFPGNWLKARPWTRTAKPREPPLSKEAKKQREIDRGWEELVHWNPLRELTALPAHICFDFVAASTSFRPTLRCGGCWWKPCIAWLRTTSTRGAWSRDGLKLRPSRPR